MTTPAHCPICLAAFGVCSRCSRPIHHGRSLPHSGSGPTGFCCDSEGEVRCLCGHQVVTGGVFVDSTFMGWVRDPVQVR